MGEAGPQLVGVRAYHTRHWDTLTRWWPCLNCHRTSPQLTWSFGMRLRDLSAGSTVHILLKHSYPLVHNGRGQWVIESKSLPKYQNQNWTVNFQGTVVSNDTATATLVANGGGHVGAGWGKMYKSGDPPRTGQATIPWRYIWQIWRIHFQVVDVPLSSPIGDGEYSTARGIVRKERLKIP